MRHVPLDTSAATVPTETDSQEFGAMIYRVYLDLYSRLL